MSQRVGLLKNISAMKRKHFLLTTLTAMPALAVAQMNASKKSTTKPFIVRAEGARYGSPMKYRGVHPNNIIISRKDTDNALSVFAYTGYAKIGPSLHLHIDQDEIFCVAEGKYRFVVGDETHELNAGDTIFLPRNIAHSWIQLSEQGKLIYAAQPAGTLEDFFIEMNELKKPPTEDEVHAIHKKHGMKVVGPPLTL
jgi:quercetin dioxygenase-like cupin family protein